MNMQSRNQYLKEVRTEYLKTKSKKKQGELLDEDKKVIKRIKKCQIKVAQIKAK